MTAWAVTTANAPLEFDTVQGTYNSCYQIDSNHFINFWSGNGNDGYVQVFTVNTSTWAVTTANASLEFDLVNGQHNSCYKIDSNHFINFWANGGIYAQVFTVNTTTWAVTTAANRLINTGQFAVNSCRQIDSNHFINFAAGEGNDGYVQVLAVNTTTWAVTTASAILEFDTQYGYYNSCYQIDSNHFINFWASISLNRTQVFTVNTTTWAVTTASDILDFDTVQGYYNSCYQIDSNHFINFSGGLDSDGYVQVFTVNTSTWAVTTANSSLEFDTKQGYYNSCFQIDSNHFINFWAGDSTDGFVQVFTVNTTTWAVTTASAPLEFDTVSGAYNSCFQIDSNHFINFWAGDSTDGFVQVFTVELPSAGPSFLSAWAHNSNAVLKVM